MARRSHVELPADLDAIIAQRVLGPVVDNAADIARDEAQRAAPPVGVWLTARDERVRPTHRDTDGQEVPDNLRFRLPSAHGTGYDMAQAPRDPDLPIEQRIACRCQVGTLPRALADSIRSGELEVVGSRVRKTVSTQFPRAAESEFGNTVDDAARFMGAGVRAANDRLREAVRR